MLKKVALKANSVGKAANAFKVDKIDKNVPLDVPLETLALRQPGRRLSVLVKSFKERNNPDEEREEEERRL